MAQALATRDDAAGALKHFERALCLMPNDVDVKLSLAWFLATCPDHSRRDAPRAVKLATEVNARTGWVSVKGHDVLAAACAAAGDTKAAVRHATKALDMARQQGIADTSAIESRLSAYAANRSAGSEDSTE
jgi:tetratricopeptide (TPR) repeat protein